MDNADPIAAAVRITRAQLKKLNGIETDSNSSRPGTPSKVSATSETMPIISTRATRRNSVSTPVKDTPSKGRSRLRSITPELNSPRRITRRRSASITEDDTLSASTKVAKEPQFDTLKEEDIDNEDNTPKHTPQTRVRHNTRSQSTTPPGPYELTPELPVIKRGRRGRKSGIKSSLLFEKIDEQNCSIEKQNEYTEESKPSLNSQLSEIEEMKSERKEQSDNVSNESATKPEKSIARSSLSEDKVDTTKSIIFDVPVNSDNSLKKIFPKTPVVKKIQSISGKEDVSITDGSFVRSTNNNDETNNSMDKECTNKSFERSKDTSLYIDPDGTPHKIRNLKVMLSSTPMMSKNITPVKDNKNNSIEKKILESEIEENNVMEISESKLELAYSANNSNITSNSKVFENSESKQLSFVKDSDKIECAQRTVDEKNSSELTEELKYTKKIIDKLNKSDACLGQGKLEENVNVPFSNSWSQNIRVVVSHNTKIDMIAEIKKMKANENNTDNQNETINSLKPEDELSESGPLTVNSDNNEDEQENEEGRESEEDKEKDESKEEEEIEKEKVINEILDMEAMDAGETYQSGDSMNSSEREEIENNEIQEEGESLGSSDTIEEDAENSESENDSFVISDSKETDNSNGSNDESNVLKFNPDEERQIYRRIIAIIHSDESQTDDNEKRIPVEETKNNLKRRNKSSKHLESEDSEEVAVNNSSKELNSTLRNPDVSKEDFVENEKQENNSKRLSLADPQTDAKNKKMFELQEESSQKTTRRSVAIATSSEDEGLNNSAIPSESVRWQKADYGSDKDDSDDSNMPSSIEMPSESENSCKQNENLDGNEKNIEKKKEDSNESQSKIDEEVKENSKAQVRNKYLSRSLNEIKEKQIISNKRTTKVLHHSIMLDIGEREQEIIKNVAAVSWDLNKSELEAVEDETQNLTNSDGLEEKDDKGENSKKHEEQEDQEEESHEEAAYGDGEEKEQREEEDEEEKDKQEEDKDEKEEDEEEEEDDEKDQEEEEEDERSSTEDAENQGIKPNDSIFEKLQSITLLKKPNLSLANRYSLDSSYQVQKESSVKNKNVKCKSLNITTEEQENISESFLASINEYKRDIQKGLNKEESKSPNNNLILEDWNTERNAGHFSNKNEIAKTLSTTPSSSNDDNNNSKVNEKKLEKRQKKISAKKLIREKTEEVKEMPCGDDVDSEIRINEGNASSLSSESTKKKSTKPKRILDQMRKQRRDEALKKAVQTSVKLLHTKMEKAHDNTNIKKTKRLPTAFLDELVNIPTKMKKTLDENKKKATIVSSAGIIVEEPASPIVRKRIKKLHLPTGVMRVEPVSPKTVGFHVTPATPSVKSTGFKVRRIIEDGQDVAPTPVKKNRKRKRPIREPVYAFPQSVNASSGQFKAAPVQTRSIGKAGATEFYMTSLKNVSSPTTIPDFKMDAILNKNIPHVPAMDVHRRKIRAELNNRY